MLPCAAESGDSRGGGVTLIFVEGKHFTVIAESGDSRGGVVYDVCFEKIGGSSLSRRAARRTLCTGYFGLLKLHN